MSEMRFAETTVLRSESLLLRSWRESDAAQVYDACQDGDIQRWTEVPSPYVMSDAQGFVDTASERWGAGLPSFGIFAADGVGLLGSIGFVRSPSSGVLEIGFWVAPTARGRGVATEATTLVCRWAFEVAEVHRIEWMAYVGNDASRRVAERCGFEFEGVSRGQIKHRGTPVDCWVAGLVR